jgi:cytochrome c oxidase assembly factor 6
MAAPTEPPSRDARQACWDGRDAYFGCLARNNLIEDDGKSCRSENSAYERNCAQSWVEYFNKRRVLDMRKQATVR